MTNISACTISVTDIASDMANTNARAPLTPAVLHILLALSAKEMHGYGIMKQVQEESQGKVKMGPGTLYGSLGRMVDAGLIGESDRKIDPEMDNERRVYYKITGLGRKALAAELERYREVVALARHNAFNNLLRLCQMITQRHDTGSSTHSCFASTRSLTASASAREWSKLSTIFCESAQRKKEECSVTRSGCSPRHSPGFLR